jgi:microcystin-dependent protein
MMMMTASAAAPDDWLFCDGAVVSRNTYSDLFDAIGTIYGAGDGLPVSFDTATSQVGTPTLVTLAMTVGYSAPLAAFAVGKKFTMTYGPSGYNNYLYTVTAVGTAGSSVTATATEAGSAVIFAPGTINTPGEITPLSPTTFQIPNTQARTVRGVGTSFINVGLGEDGGVDVVQLSAPNVPSHQHGVTNATAPFNHLPSYISDGFPGANGSYNVGNGGSQYYTNATTATIFDAAGTLVTAAAASGEAFPIVNKFLGLNYIIKT